MKSNIKGYRNLFKLAMKYRVKVEDEKATCLHCGHTEQLAGPFSSYPLLRHIEEHINNDEITEKNVMG